jgi:hypothetical protein
LPILVRVQSPGRRSEQRSGASEGAGRHRIHEPCTAMVGVEPPVAGSSDDDAEAATAAATVTAAESGSTWTFFVVAGHHHSPVPNVAVHAPGSVQQLQRGEDQRSFRVAYEGGGNCCLAAKAEAGAEVHSRSVADERVEPGQCQLPPVNVVFVVRTRNSSADDTIGELLQPRRQAADGSRL